MFNPSREQVRLFFCDAWKKHVDRLPLVGAGEPVTEARHALESSDAVLVVEDGKPIGVITRHDLLAFVTKHPIAGGSHD